MKYKVYDTILKRIGEVTDIEWLHEGIVRTIMYDHNFDFDDGYNVLIGGEDGILLQFTGLIDKNNTELYENDIVVDNVGRVWVIYYRANLATFVFLYRGQSNSWQTYMQFNKEQKPLIKIGTFVENPQIITKWIEFVKSNKGEVWELVDKFLSTEN